MHVYNLQNHRGYEVRQKRVDEGGGFVSTRVGTRAPACTTPQLGTYSRSAGAPDRLHDSPSPKVASDPTGLRSFELS